MINGNKILSISGKVCGGRDSNPRRSAPQDLKSCPFGQLGYPRIRINNPFNPFPGEFHVFLVAVFYWSKTLPFNRFSTEKQPLPKGK